MKKAIVIFLAVIMLVSLTACSGGNKKAFEASLAAYNNIELAYEITEDFGSDLYEAWRLGIYDDDEILDDGLSHLASELSLSLAELEDGFCYTYAYIMGEDWESMTDADKSSILDKEKLVLSVFEDDLFSYCVMFVTNAYIVNGKAEEAQLALDSAKAQMKELSEKYSDYEHYPNLKGYYTTTSSFFDFCQNPSGSFEQVKDTINDYKNEARDYISDLDYIFEE